MRNRQVEERREGALRRAPFVLGATFLVMILSLIAMVRGWWLDQQLPVSSPPYEKPPSHYKPSANVDLPLPIEVVIDIKEDQVGQKQAGDIAGRVFLFIHHPMKSKEERLEKLSEFVTDPVFREIQVKSDLPLEPVTWKKIKVVSVRPLASDHWSFLVAGVTRWDEVDSTVQIQVRKVAGVWKVVSIDE